MKTGEVNLSSGHRNLHGRRTNETESWNKDGRRATVWSYQRKVHKPRKAAETLRNLRYLAMANMSDNYNFEDFYFPLRSEERRAIERTKRGMITNRLVPEGKIDVLMHAVPIEMLVLQA